MAKKLLWDLSNKGKLVGISADLKNSTLTNYYLLFSDDLAKLNALIIGFDDDGIPLNKPYIDIEGGEPHYYPISIGQVALSIFNNFIRTGNKQKIDHFLSIADWFLESRQEDPELGTFWETHVPKPEYGVNEGWKSAFTQSRAISVLLRAWQQTQEIKYIESAKSALIPFTKDITDGGVAIRKSDSPIFYEEYVASVPTRVLDGHCFALFGLFDFVRAVPAAQYPKAHELAISLFREGIDGLVESLPNYDLGFWARFNLCELPDYPTDDPCTITYLQLVIVQLKILYQITDHPDLLKYHLKFANYITWPNIMKMYQSKFKSLKNLNRI